MLSRLSRTCWLHELPSADRHIVCRKKREREREREENSERGKRGERERERDSVCMCVSSKVSRTCKLFEPPSADRYSLSKRERQREQESDGQRDTETER